jgi:hypothetical protein
LVLRRSAVVVIVVIAAARALLRVRRRGRMRLGLRLRASFRVLLRLGLRLRMGFLTRLWLRTRLRVLLRLRLRLRMEFLTRLRLRTRLGMLLRLGLRLRTGLGSRFGLLCGPGLRLRRHFRAVLRRGRFGHPLLRLRLSVRRFVRRLHGERCRSACFIAARLTVGGHRCVRLRPDGLVSLPARRVHGVRSLAGCRHAAFRPASHLRRTRHAVFLRGGCRHAGLTTFHGVGGRRAGRHARTTRLSLLSLW